MSSGVKNNTWVPALVALTTVLVAALAAAFLMVQSVFPWMTVLNPSQAATSDPVEDTVQVVDVTTGGPTSAERTLQRVMEVSVPALTRWHENAGNAVVPGVSFGFGCDPADGLAPVVAESRSWVLPRTDTSSPVTGLAVSARAYPAGGGAVAFTGLGQAVLACDAASLYPTGGLGVEAVQVHAGTSTSLVWRRGRVHRTGGGGARL